MSDDLNGDLEALAGRGRPRGDDEVLRAARAASASASSPARHLRIPVVIAAVLAIVAASAVVIRSSSDGERTPTAIGSTTSTTGAPVVALNASSLVRFDDCSALLDEIRARASDHVGPYGIQGIGGWGVYFGAEDAQHQPGPATSHPAASHR